MLLLSDFVSHVESVVIVQKPPVDYSSSFSLKKIEEERNERPFSTRNMENERMLPCYISVTSKNVHNDSAFNLCPHKVHNLGEVEHKANMKSNRNVFF